MSLDIGRGIALINKAREQERDNRFFAQWVVQLPAMGRDDFVSFSEYKDMLTGANIDMRSTAVIMAELDDIEAQLERKGDEA